MTTIPFTKMVGAGNDFLIVDARARRLSSLTRRWPAVARALCDRRSGVGADGLLVLGPSPSADVRMRVLNPDGSEAGMCGNGARCVALYQAASRTPHAATRRTVTIETKAGVLSATVSGHRVAMRMTDPTDVRPELSVAVDGRRLRLGSANTGVPHAVVPVQSVAAVDVDRLGRALRRHPRFAPRGTNVNFVQPDPARPGRIRIRTYERGVEGETPACGTGAAASAVLHVLRRRGKANGRLRRERVEVLVQSGDRLRVELDVVPTAGGLRATNVVLEGPARRVFDGTVGYSSRGGAAAWR